MLKTKTEPTFPELMDNDAGLMSELARCWTLAKKIDPTIETSQLERATLKLARQVSTNGHVSRGIHLRIELIHHFPSRDDGHLAVDRPALSRRICEICKEE